MNTFRRLINRFKLRLRGKNRIVGWNMTPSQARAFFGRQKKAVLPFFGYSSAYEDEAAMLRIVREVLSEVSPEDTLVNIGATRGCIGAAYPLAKSLGFRTIGIVSSQALDYPDEISEAVDYVCFITDEQWGGKLPESDQLSPTSEAMVTCSDVLVGIGGNEIGRDGLLAGKEQGKPVHFYPAEVNHAWAIRRAERTGSPPSDSFWGATHKVFGEQEK